MGGWDARSGYQAGGLLRRTQLTREERKGGKAERRKVKKRRWTRKLPGWPRIRRKTRNADTAEATSEHFDGTALLVKPAGRYCHFISVSVAPFIQTLPDRCS